MDMNNHIPEDGIPENNQEHIQKEAPAPMEAREIYIPIKTEQPVAEAPRRPGKRRRRIPKRTLAREYLHYWYVILISLMCCAPAYLLEIFFGSWFMAKNVAPLLSALLTMFLGGFIATFPFLVLNIYLVAKKKKYYAIAIQLIAMEGLGLLFYLYSRIAIAMA